MAAKILTANRLSDGRVIWYTKNKQWCDDSSNVFIAQSDEDIALLEEALKKGVEDNLLVDANLIDVDATGSHRPLRLRERIRQNGPTIAYGASTAHL